MTRPVLPVANLIPAKPALVSMPKAYGDIIQSCHTDTNDLTRVHANSIHPTIIGAIPHAAVEIQAVSSVDDAARTVMGATCTEAYLCGDDGCLQPGGCAVHADWWMGALS